MKTRFRLSLAVALWLVSLALCAHAQLDNDQWFGVYRDHLHSMSTPVRLSDQLNIDST